MIVLADSGVLLRLLEPSDPDHGFAVRSVSALEVQGNDLVVAMQNLAEFWNVCTRPLTARGGMGLTPAATQRRLSVLEGMFGWVLEKQRTYPIWRYLVTTIGVRGKQVHDARLVALMQSHGIDHILTFNTADFARYPGLTVFDPRTY